MPILLGNAVPPVRRSAVPASRSDAMRSGTRARRCSVLSLAAMSSGEPIETISPPTCSESTHDSDLRERGVVVGRVGAGDPGHDQLRDLVARASCARSACSTCAFVACLADWARRAVRSERQGRRDHDHWQGESMHLLRHAFGLSLAGVLVTACATAQAPAGPRQRCARASTCWSRTACTWCRDARSACSRTAPASTGAACPTSNDSALPG